MNRYGRIVIGSFNPGKIREIETIMSSAGIQWIPASDIPGAEKIDESGSTFSENADLKAVYFSRLSGLPALADDSGLEVDALGGLPGVQSNRLFGEHLPDREKTNCLLQRLRDVPVSERTARFQCVASLAVDGRIVHRGYGTVEGYILETPVGEAGFGYDPVFFYTAENKSFAQLTAAEKSRFSHRGRAMLEIYEFLLRNTD